MEFDRFTQKRASLYRERLLSNFNHPSWPADAAPLPRALCWWPWGELGRPQGCSRGLLHILSYTCVGKKLVFERRKPVFGVPCWWKSGFLQVLGLRSFIFFTHSSWAVAEEKRKKKKLELFRHSRHDVEKLNEMLFICEFNKMQAGIAPLSEAFASTWLM